ncbi:hypothetical protein OF829_06975 [Sphingomonas sp. LB-2]|nr:hypothetical protein [Sphingomonas caeni]
MAIAKDMPGPAWRNVAAWSGVGAVVYFLILWAGALIVNGEGVVGIFRAMLGSQRLAATLGGSLVLAVAVTGFSSRKRPLNLRTLRNFMIHNVMAITAFLLAIWGFTRLNGAGALGAMGSSTWAAFVTGVTLIVIACMGTLALASVHTRADLVEDEAVAEEMHDRGRLFLCSFTWIAACGLLLIVLGLAGPGRLVSPQAALMGAVALIAILAVLGIVSWRLSDELGRTLSYETGNMAFYLIWVLGSGWAILAHLGFVAAPAPLDWLTLFVILLFAASFIVLGRRRLLTR